ncbi:hypothetical protein AMAG_13930 [Allomyces macrogynus ATCC 38327]|uniref:Clathrin/coatomer adaptor adaptin-like N-terminal domain-containing protein n=1 Tax=Allomyces macrogynus (strain ATCC 38327) TaxID=578462 RepID=A0A0L0T3B8_ALLM3|nr:hypothetical protein AMAG_13930 [Allomyces macrogynus ATCC 38327]|eukprot:KNE69059.1 hypothetical protein AMAG_13930 [Allomyces macrogynus ATCC 38327]
MADAKYFSKGKATELDAEFRLADKAGKGAKKKEILKRVIANMTMGTDMSSLFHQVIQCAALPGIDVKKMIYLYLINYAKQVPDLCTLAVNLLLKDTRDPNPLTRAQALRTMGYITTPEMLDSMCDALRAATKDDDPFVRKTAVVGISKLFINSADMCQREGFLETLSEMVYDANGAVMASALAVLKEIAPHAPSVTLQLDLTKASKLITALDECSEWYQVYVLDALMQFVPATPDDALLVCDRITNRLQHANSAVSMTVLKVILHLLDYVPNDDAVASMCSKLTPPLITLMSRSAEIQYTALRNIVLILDKRPQVLADEVKAFFCKYNDPIYVKMAKLEVLVRLVNKKNCPQVLLELKEYASEADVEFVRKAVKCIGRCAIQIEPMADACIRVLMDLIETRVSYVLQEAVVVLKDIFRRYPNRYEQLLGALTEQLEAIDEPDAKAAYIWILGHYAGNIAGACDALRMFLADILLDSANVQLALLNAAVKTRIAQAPGSDALLDEIVAHLTDSVDNPDVRDRAIMYGRMFKQHPAVVQSVLAASKPTISLESDGVPPHLVHELLLELGSLASILHRPAATFLGAAAVKTVVLGQADGDNNAMGGGYADTADQSVTQQQQQQSPSAGGAGGARAMNLLDMDEPAAVVPSPTQMGGYRPASPGTVSSATDNVASSMSYQQQLSSLAGAVPSVAAGSMSQSSSMRAISPTQGIAGMGGSATGSPYHRPSMVPEEPSGVLDGPALMAPVQPATFGAAPGLGQMFGGTAPTASTTGTNGFGGAASAIGGTASGFGGAATGFGGAASGFGGPTSGFGVATSSFAGPASGFGTGGIGAPSALGGLAADLAGMSLASPVVVADTLLLARENGKCLEIQGAMRRDPYAPAGTHRLCLSMKMSNAGIAPMDGLMIRLNVNPFGLQLDMTAKLPIVRPGSVPVPVTVPLVAGPVPPYASWPEIAKSKPLTVQAAIRTPTGTEFFLIPAPVQEMVSGEVVTDPEAYAMLQGSSGQVQVKTLASANMDRIVARLKTLRVTVAPPTNMNGTKWVVVSGCLLGGQKFAVQLAAPEATASTTGSVQIKAAAAIPNLDAGIMEFVESLA